MGRFAGLVFLVGALLAANSSAAPTAVQTAPEVQVDALSWSPSGAWLAYVVTDFPAGKRNGLYLIRANRSGGHHPVVGHDLSLDWSPSGTQLAASDGTTTWLVTPRRSVTQVDGQFADWSPDGKQVLLQRPSSSSPRTTIWIGDASTGEARYLVDGVAPRWSPDGSRIAYSVVVRTNLFWCSETHLYSVASSGGEPLRLTNDPAPYEAQTASSWFSDSRILYAEGGGCVEGGSGRNAMVAPADGSRRTRVLGEGWPSLLPHGRIALQSFESYGPSIEIVTASGRQTAHFSNAFEFGSSPDGRRIAYSDSSHVVVGWTGKSTDRHSLGRGTHPSWSKQNWIAFLAEGSCGRTVERVFVVRPNGKHRHVLTRCPSPG